MKEESKIDVFESWIMNIQERIDNWLFTLEEEFVSQLDYSPNSLLLLGTILLDSYDFNTFKMMEDKTTPDGFVSYLGETLRKNLEKSMWSIELHNPDDLFFNIPVIKYKTQTPISPHSLIMRTLKKRDAEFLFKFYEKRIKM